MEVRPIGFIAACKAKKNKHRCYAVAQGSLRTAFATDILVATKTTWKVRQPDLSTCFRNV